MRTCVLTGVASAKGFSSNHSAVLLRRPYCYGKPCCIATANLNGIRIPHCGFRHSNTCFQFLPESPLHSEVAFTFLLSELVSPPLGRDEQLLTRILGRIHTELCAASAPSGSSLRPFPNDTDFASADELTPASPMNLTSRFSSDLLLKLYKELLQRLFRFHE